MDLLRQRAGLQGSRVGRKREGDDVDLQIARAKEQVAAEEATAAVAGPSTLTSKSGHINFFEDLEQVSCPPSPVPCAGPHADRRRRVRCLTSANPHDYPRAVDEAGTRS